MKVTKALENVQIHLVSTGGSTISLLITSNNFPTASIFRDNDAYSKLVKQFDEEIIIEFISILRTKTTSHLRLIALIKDYYNISLRDAKDKFDLL